MVDAVQNVTDSQAHVASSVYPAPAISMDDERGRQWPQDLGHTAAVRERDPYQNVEDGHRETLDCKLLIRETLRLTLDRSALHHGPWCFLGDEALRDRTARRKDRVDRWRRTL